MKIDELNLIIYKLENEVFQLKALSDLKTEPRAIKSKSSKTNVLRPVLEKSTEL